VKLFTHQIFLLALLLISMLFQFQVIWKIESSLMEYTPLAVASLMFVPHGIRAIAIVLSGAKAFVPIFLTHLITDLLIGLTLTAGLLSGVATVIAMATPLLLINFLSHKKPFEPLAQGSTENLSLFRLVIVVGAISSLVNGAIGSIRYSTSPLDLVAVKYFVGDLMGVLLILAILLGLKKPLLVLGRKII